MPDDSFGRRELLSFSDERWAKIISHLPKPLPAAAAERLRLDITDCCPGTSRNRPSFNGVRRLRRCSRPAAITNLRR